MRSSRKNSDDIQNAVEAARKQRATLRADQLKDIQHDIDNAETIIIPSSPRRSSKDDESTHEPWPGHVKASKKTAGANDAGPYGGVYKEVDIAGDTVGMAMIKRDTVLGKKGNPDKVRVGKIIGEFVAGRMLTHMMVAIHEHDDPDYASKYIADVSLVKAVPYSKEEDNEVALTYLKSVFLPNYANDFWKEAFIRHHGKQFEELYGKQYAEALRRDSKEDSSAAIKQVARKAAEEMVDEEHSGKPKQVRQSLLKQYDDETIVRPKEMLEKNPQLMTDFCEQTAARLLLADYGIHTGNFGVINDGSGTPRMGSIDFGAAFCNLLPDVEPFTRTGTGTKFYKNHLLEYHPNIIKSTEMAKAFIKIGSFSEQNIKLSIGMALGDLIKSETYETPQSLSMFCKRLGMPKKKYDDIDSKDDLYSNLFHFMNERIKQRCESMLNKGYGLLLEHCMDGNTFDMPSVKRLLTEYPGLASYITSDSFSDYIPVLEEKYAGKKMNSQNIKYLQKEIEALSANVITPREEFSETKIVVDDFARRIFTLDAKLTSDSSEELIKKYRGMQPWVNATYKALANQIEQRAATVESPNEIEFIKTMRKVINEAYELNRTMGEKVHTSENKLREKIAPPTPPPRSIDDMLNNMREMLDDMSQSLLSIEAKAVPAKGKSASLASNPAATFKKPSDAEHSADNTKEEEYNRPKYGTKDSSKE